MPRAPRAAEAAPDRPHTWSEPFRPGAPIVPELGSGGVIVGPGGRRILLLHEHREDRWEYPKGHVDPGESLTEAALREIREETGLNRVVLGEELGEVSYRFYHPKKGHNVHKTTVYFLARTEETGVRPEPTFDRYEWVTLTEARRRLPYGSDLTILRAAAERLRAR